jgi:heme oxygenase
MIEHLEGSDRMSGIFMLRMRKAIRPLHDEAEKTGPLHAVLKKSASLEDYKKALVRLYGFTAPAERLIESQLLTSGVSLEYEKRKRAESLQKDLIFLGYSPQEIHRIPIGMNIPAIDTPTKALGCLYLFEGSRLGGQVLTNALVERFGFVDGRGYAYFGSYGLDVPSLWETFKSTMEDYVNSGGPPEEVIQSAVDCFAALNGWLGAE